MQAAAPALSAAQQPQIPALMNVRPLQHVKRVITGPAFFLLQWSSVPVNAFDGITSSHFY